MSTGIFAGVAWLTIHVQERIPCIKRHEPRTHSVHRSSRQTKSSSTRDKQSNQEISSFETSLLKAAGNERKSDDEWSDVNIVVMPLGCINVGGPWRRPLPFLHLERHLRYHLSNGCSPARHSYQRSVPRAKYQLYQQQQRSGQCLQ